MLRVPLLNRDTVDETNADAVEECVDVPEADRDAESEADIDSVTVVDSLRVLDMDPDSE